MGYSGAQGTLIHKINLKLKISCQTPFKDDVTIIVPLYVSFMSKTFTLSLSTVM
jgi:hypothetical protein